MNFERPVGTVVDIYRTLTLRKLLNPSLFAWLTLSRKRSLKDGRAKLRQTRRADPIQLFDVELSTTLIKDMEVARSETLGLPLWFKSRYFISMLNDTVS